MVLCLTLSTATESLELGTPFISFMHPVSGILRNTKTTFYFSRKKKRSEGGPSTGKIQIASRVEKEYLKPTYSASIGVELEDGLFDGT